MYLMLVGDYRHREFHSAANWLSEQQDCSLLTENRVEIALARVESSMTYPDAIVAFQARPGQFSQSQVEQLRAAAPMARLLLLQGGWCEGEPHAGRRLQGVVAAHWTQWRHFLPPILADSTAATSSPWRIPNTATDAEQSLAAAQSPLPNGAGAISIWANSYDTFRAIASVCGAGGFSCTWARHPHTVCGAAAAIWDGDLEHPRQRDGLQWLAAETAPAPVVALINFPHVEDLSASASLGAAAVLAKPYRIGELLAELRRLITSSQPERQPQAA